MTRREARTLFLGAALGAVLGYGAARVERLGPAWGLVGLALHVAIVLVLLRSTDPNP